MPSPPHREGLPAGESLPPLKTTSSRPKLRTVGFTPEANTSPSSVLRQAADSPSSSGRAAPEVVESPLSNALRRERSAPQLPQLPKLKLGLRGSKGGAGMQRSKSHGNLRQASAAVPTAPAPSKSATSSPHAASSGGSEPVRIPFELSRQRHRRTRSVDFHDGGGGGGTGSVGPTSEADQERELSSSVISAASSLLGHHLGAGPGTGGPGSLASARESPTASAAGAASSGAPTRTHSAARDLYLAQADAVTAHAQVQSLQGALRREQEEVLRLREQLQLMTAERDRLLAELQLGGAEGGAPVFDMEAPPGASSAPRAGTSSDQQQQLQSGRLTPPPALQQQQPRMRSALRTVFRLP